VYASYRWFPLRLDAVVLTRGLKIEIRRGEPRSAAPTFPAVTEGERRLGSIWLPGRVAKLQTVAGRVLRSA
jgi:hypothetical protein